MFSSLTSLTVQTVFNMSKKSKRSFLSRHPKLKKIVYSFYGILIIFLIILPVPLFILPKKYVYKLSRFLSQLFVFPFIREKTIKNLKYAYGGRMTDFRANAIAKKCAANLLFSAVDCYYLWFFKPFYNFDNIIIEVKNTNCVYDSLKKKNGIFVATPHYGCFEIIPAFFAMKLNLTGGVIARKFPSDLLTWLNRKARQLHKVPSFYDEARAILKNLRSNNVIGILPDLNAKKRLGIPSSFFGKETLTLDIHVRLASQTGAPIVPAFINRHVSKPWQYTMIFYPPVCVDKKVPQEIISKKVQEINDIFEEHIKCYPSGWIWFHNKWKLW